MGKLEGRVALLTGTGRGIGRSLALKLAREGARLVINDLDRGPAQEALEAIESGGGEAVSYVGDVTAPDFADGFVGMAVDQYGTPDIIVNNAGYTWDRVIQNTSDEQFQAMLDVHVIAPFRILRAAAGPIRAAARAEAAAGLEVFRKVVNVSSVSGIFGNPGQVSYGAGKAGIIGLTKSLAREWGRYRVNVNCIAFGLIETRLTQPITDAQASIDIAGREIKVGVHAQRLEAVKHTVPLGRAGTPDEAADAIYLFCIPESNYITGQVLIVDGGAR